MSFGAESPFNFEELFFSRTNLKGIIESGNSVFQRVSQYDWDEILKKPHSLIRHPAMPRGVFHLFWETILSGKPIGAYVVNLAKDGTHYWVYALAMPIEGGFVSIRLKPSSAIFQVVKEKYADLLEIEKTKKIIPKESQKNLLETIASLGFHSYQQFMTEALTQELESRQKSISLPPIKALSQLREVLAMGTQLQKKCDDIFEAYSKSILVPLNLEVQAARIGQEAAPIAVISSQYEGLAKQIREEIKKIVGASRLVQEKVGNCQFEICNSLLQQEMFSFFRDEDRPSPIQKEVEMNHLEKLSRDGIGKAKQSLVEVDFEFGKFRTIYEEVRKLSTALEIVSISGKIEAAKIKQSSGALEGLLSDLVEFKTALKNSLKEIDTIGNGLIVQTREMKAGLS